MVDTYFYYAKLNENFSEGEFDHLVILQKNLANKKIQYRPDEVKELKKINITDFEFFISKEFDKFACIQNM